MERIYNNHLRVGNFTSSEIAALMTEGKAKGSFGKPALTYIEECNFERIIGVALDLEANSKPLIWGKFLEKRVFDMLGIEYQYSSETTIMHPNIDCWSGSRDGMIYTDGGIVIEAKCPMTRKSFCRFITCESIEEIREKHPDGEKYYWQMVSNAVLAGAKYAELVVYMPYLSELDDIREESNNYDGNPNEVAFINFASDNQLPWIPDGGMVHNLYKWRFEVPEEDKERLTQRVLEAREYLLDRG
jgi:hypothetical protein